MKLTLTIDDEFIDKLSSQIASKLNLSVQPDFQAVPKPKETELLKQENHLLLNKLTELEKQVQTLASLTGQTNQTTQEAKQTKDHETDEIENQLRQDLQWLDEGCHFKKAQGRTWRQLSNNYGAKISMNGKGMQSPRFYLQAIKSWQDCQIEARIKAKLALELGKKVG